MALAIFVEVIEKDKINLSSKVKLADETESLAFGRRLATAILDSGKSLVVVHLKGDLGAGKTTMSRGILQGFGHKGQVKSPTYTLVEPYQLERIDVFHFDLYRLGDPEELEFMGIRDYFDKPKEGEKPVVCLVEWPERGADYVAKADASIELTLDGLSRVANIKVDEDWLRLEV